MRTKSTVFDRLAPRLRKRSIPPGALVLSLLVHVVVLTVLAPVFFGRNTEEQPSPEHQLIFDLVEENIERTASHAFHSELEELVGRPNQANVNDLQKVGRKIGLAASRSNVLVAPDAKVNTETVMMASLQNLLDVKTNVNFLLQEMTADSVGKFTPLQGTAPETDFLLDGIVNGFGAGSRSGLRVRFGGRRGGRACPTVPPDSTRVYEKN